MSEEIKLIFIPDDCNEACPIINACHATALDLASRAQALFQSFLKCLEHNIQEHWHPEYKNGARLLEVFTHKLDETQVFNSICKGMCPYRNGELVLDENHQFNHKGELLEQMTQEIARLTELYATARDYNQEMQRRCDELEGKVSNLLEELTKRRYQYANRILISIFEERFDLHKEHFCHKSFFDIVSREHLNEFILFLRHILLGPALSQEFDDKVDGILEPYKDDHGSVPITRWDEVMAINPIQHLMTKIASVFYERSLCSSFHQLVIRKSSIARKNVPAFIQLMELIGADQREYAKAV